MTIAESKVDLRDKRVGVAMSAEAARRNACATLLQAETIELGLLVHVVFAGVAEDVFELTSFLGERPQQRLAGRNRLRRPEKNRVAKGVLSTDDPPAMPVKHIEHVRQE